MCTSKAPRPPPFSPSPATPKPATLPDQTRALLPQPRTNRVPPPIPPVPAIAPTPTGRTLWTEEIDHPLMDHVNYILVLLIGLLCAVAAVAGLAAASPFPTPSSW